MAARGRPPGSRNAKGAWRTMMDVGENSVVTQAEAEIGKAKRQYKEACRIPRDEIKTIRNRCVARLISINAKRKENA